METNAWYRYVESCRHYKWNITYWA